MQKIIRKSLQKRVFSYEMLNFCTRKEGEGKEKFESVAFKNDNVHDYNKIAYHPKHPLEFQNGKALIYEYKKTAFGSFLRSLPFLLPFTSIAYTIYLNPFANFFPAAIPILGIVELGILKYWLTRLKWNQNIVKKIYLLENGDIAQIHFANEWKRKMFGEPLKAVYYNSVFVNPDFSQQDVLVFSHNLFPETIPEGSESEKFGFAWTKHYSNGENFILIPKKASIINMEVLIEVFKGKIIQTKLL